MFRDQLVIDVHGHLSSPPQVRAYAYNLIALRNRPSKFDLSDEAVKPAMDRHLRMLDSHDIDVQLLSPRPVAMMHWERPFLVEPWTRTVNDLIAQQMRIAPDRFIGVAGLPQNSETDTANCIPELERAINELGFVGAIVNPDPAGDGKTPGMDKPYWFPLYAKAEELNATLVVHPCGSRDPRLESVARSYQFSNLVEETLATQLLEQNDVFSRFPKLRVVVCHCGGALNRLLSTNKPVDYVAYARGEDNLVRDSGEKSGGQVGIPVTWSYAGNSKPVASTLVDKLFFDSCAYDPYFVQTAIRQRGVDRILLGTESPGAGSHQINPQTNAPADDLVKMIDGFDFLTDDDKTAIFTTNALRAFPRLKLPARTPAAR
jgi:predicted TIM-barrel fold metal-dependent hydrolase